jgi:VanZ family protein
VCAVVSIASSTHWIRTLSRSPLHVRPVRLQLIPLAIAAILLTTAVAVELRPAVWWDGGFDTADFLENMLLYMPLGAALGRYGWRLVIPLAAVLSIAAEIVQIWSFERFSSPHDVVANVLGACMGFWMWRRYRHLEYDGTYIALPGIALVGCLIVAVLALSIAFFPLKSSAIANWDASFQPVAGNETTADRPWVGSIRDVKVLAGALSPQKIRELSGTANTNEVQLDLITLYERPEPLALTGGSAVALAPGASRELVEQISAHNAFSLLVRIKMGSIEQTGPARIVSFSRGTLERNFDLGQEQQRLIFRVRTPVSGANGEDFRVETLPILKPQTETLVVATYDGVVSRIFVDGTLYGRSNLFAAGCAIGLMCDAALPAVWSVFGGAVALLALALLPESVGRSRIVLATVLSICVIVVGIQLMGSFERAMLPVPWAKWMAVVGAAVVGTAAFCASPSLSARATAR